MKNDELIIRYLDNQLTEREKVQFEKDLVSNPVLRERFRKIKNNLKLLKTGSEVQADGSYFNNMITEFRKRSEISVAKKRFPAFGLLYKYTAGFAVIIILTLVLVLTNEKTSTVDLSDLSSDEITNIYNLYSAAESTDNFIPEASQERVTAKIDSVIAEDYVLADSSLNYLDHSDYNILVASLTDEQADEIYNRLLNKNFLPGGEQ